MSAPGDILRSVEVGPPAHGGHCVARVDGRVVFVRHSAPGEVVDVRLTDAGEKRKFWRGDAVEVHEPSPSRVESRWPEAGPGGVGGGELAHLTLVAQREWKAEVVRDALRRIGHLDLSHLGPITVRPVGDDDARDGLATRTRITLVLDKDARAGMSPHRSHEILALQSMPLAVPAISELEPFAPGRWDGLAPGTRLEVVAPSNGPVVVLADGVPVDPDDVASFRPAPAAPQRGGVGRGGAGRPGGDRRGGDRRGRDRRGRNRRAPAPPAPARVGVRERVPSRLGDLNYRVDAAGFWQVHQDAPATLVEAVLAAARPEPGQRIAELYSGAGLFTLPLALSVGAQGRVDALEVSERAVKDARRHLHDAPQAVLHHAAVTAATLEGLAPAGELDAVVLDPPRAGAGEQVMAAIARLRPRTVVLVACDPAALARDLRSAVDHGYEVVELSAYDLFPHTHHVECLAVLRPQGS